MQQLVDLIQLPNGNLKIEILYKDEPGKELQYASVMDDLEGIRRSWENKDRSHYQDLMDIIEYWNTDDEYEVLPEYDYEHIGALTSAPIIAYQVDRDDQGNWQDVQKVWWYPGYELSDAVEELFKNGFVIFQSGEA